MVRSRAVILWSLGAALLALALWIAISARRPGGPIIVIRPNRVESTSPQGYEILWPQIGCAVAPVAALCYEPGPILADRFLPKNVVKSVSAEVDSKCVASGIIKEVTSVVATIQGKKLVLTHYPDKDILEWAFEGSPVAAKQESLLGWNRWPKPFCGTLDDLIVEGDGTKCALSEIRSVTIRYARQSGDGCP